MNYHEPVLLQESIEGLEVSSGKIFIDCTLGGGGHTESILKKNKEAFVYAFDQDLEAIKYSQKRLSEFSERIEFIHSNFSAITTQLALRKVNKVDGILMDLGVSGHQFDEGERGFSFKKEARLDMRMSNKQKETAFDVINNESSDKLVKIFKKYGEEREAKRIVHGIALARKKKDIETTTELAEIIENNTKSRHKSKAKARIFQAVRIYLNNELSVLETALRESTYLLNPGRRIAVISYHSLEDRIVKQYFRYCEKDCICPPRVLKCTCNKIKTMKRITKKPIIPTENEVKRNGRARSAKLRIAEKLNYREELQNEKII